MSPVLKSVKPGSYHPCKPSVTPQNRPRLVVVPAPSATVEPPARLPVQRRYPFWFKVLLASQWVSGGIAAIAITGAAVTYALTVDMNRQLTNASTTLENSQKQQRQLTSAKAVFQNHLANTALTAVQGAMLHPKDVIFLEGGDAHPTPPPSSKNPDLSVPDSRPLPIGY